MVKGAFFKKCMVLSFLLKTDTRHVYENFKKVYYLFGDLFCTMFLKVIMCTHKHQVLVNVYN